MLKSCKLSFSAYNLVRWHSTAVKAIKKTCLYDFHLEHKAKMVEFAGFQMPVLYPDQSISASHLHTRNHVSIFDVSHMLQTTICGKDCLKFMESLTVADIQGLNENQGILTLFTNENGGIIDDLIVTKINSNCLYVVSNAGCIEKDLTHMQRNMELFREKKQDVEIQVLDDHALLAIQGPGMSSILQPVVDYNLSELTFMTSTVTSVCGIKNCRITRCGYTGEDGVEISVPKDKAKHIVESLLASKDEEAKLAGLAVRDSLRLEAGLCLYGNDINESTTPVEAGLIWTIGKRRRSLADFPGGQIILKQLKEKPEQKRVGITSVGPSARAATPILDGNKTVLGHVTSGLPSPCLSRNIAMGYVPTSYSKVGTKLWFEIRKKIFKAEVVKLPFLKSKYYINN